MLCERWYGVRVEPLGEAARTLLPTVTIRAGWRGQDPSKPRSSGNLQTDLSSMRSHPKDRLADAKAVLFDYGGTLDANGIPWKERFGTLLANEGFEVPSERFDPAFYAADDAMVGGVPESLSYADTVSRLAESLVVALGLEAPALGQRLGQRFLSDSLGQLSTNAGVLDALSRRYRLGIVSNFYGNLERVCEDVGIARFMTVMVDSTRVGWTKPAPAIFEAALRVLDVEPERAIFVGDSLRRDRSGAAAMGMPFIWFRGDNADAPSDDDFLTINALEQLEEWLL